MASSQMTEDYVVIHWCSLTNHARGTIMIELCGGMEKGVEGHNKDVWYLGTWLTMDILEKVS